MSVFMFSPFPYFLFFVPCSIDDANRVVHGEVEHTFVWILKYIVIIRQSPHSFDCVLFDINYNICICQMNELKNRHIVEGRDGHGCLAMFTGL